MYENYDLPDCDYEFMILDYYAFATVTLVRTCSTDPPDWRSAMLISADERRIALG